ncbi:MAG TPA: hypothetical protein VFU90_03755, partial [Candidatus Tumulicola sp.]|nr:hypothetical protein [Candidatus Tumulicola sp.]
VMGWVLMAALIAASFFETDCGGRVDEPEDVAAESTADPGETVVDCSAMLDGYPLDFLVTIRGPSASLQLTWAGPDATSAVRTYPDWDGAIAVETASTTLEWQVGWTQLKDTNGLVSSSSCR